MEDRYGKYIRLFGTLFFTLLGLLLAFLLLLLGVRLLFGLLDYLPWSVYIYTFFIMAVPFLLFTSVFIIYLRRTRHHPSIFVRYFSYGIFLTALGFWLVFFIQDVRIFFKHAYTSIEYYHSYEMILLAANVAALFLVGVMQALSMPAEKDWMHKYKSDTNEI